MDALAYIVLVEWDGTPPPNTFYRRLRGLALPRVRGDKSQPPVPRRLGDQGIIFQEGAFIVRSRSLARAIASLAQTYGAKAVQVGTITLLEEMAPSPEDLRALERIQSVLGRRGGPHPQPPTYWVVACLEDGGVYTVHAPRVLNCPHCGGVRIRPRRGLPNPYSDPGGDPIEAWIRTRFAMGVWEPPVPGDRPVLPPANVRILLEGERAVVESIKSSPHLRLPRDREAAFQILDAILVARCYWPPQERQEARLRAVLRYFSAGGEARGISLVEPPQPDLLDASGPMGDEIVFHLFATGGEK